MLGLVGLLFGILLLVAYIVILDAVLMYKAWSAIQPGHPRTTPGRAIGYAFIPFYNFYWIFQKYWGFAKDYNSYAAQRGAPAYRLNEKLFLAYCILTLCDIIPFVNYVAAIPSIVIWVIAISNVCNSINHIADTAVEQTPAPAAVESESI
jgi:hypothetical protein